MPGPLKRWLRSIHRRAVFLRAMKRFLRDPLACARPGDPVLRALVYGWGNEGWSAKDEYLAASLREVLAGNASVLECGSGLSTLLIGAARRASNAPHWALEHNPEWGARVQKALDQYGVRHVTLHIAPLKSRDGFDWYDPPMDRIPQGFGLVICDGPPSNTRGGRVGLLPVMRRRLAPGAVILLDDAARGGERDVAERWRAEWGARPQEAGVDKPYFRIVVPGPGDREPGATPPEA
jgi:predicted O-methyltransferase YrrM